MDIYIRQYEPGDLAEISRLFYDTVHTVNAGDYTPEQLDAWAPAGMDTSGWDRRLRDSLTLAAVCSGTICGFASMERSGFLDMLFVRRDRQRAGIASALCDRLEAGVSGDITTYASKTALPFFLHRGYEIVSEQQVERNGVWLTNYAMCLRR